MLYPRRFFASASLFILLLFVVEGVFAQGQALSLDGTDQYVHIPDNNTLDLTTPFTLEAWVNISKTNGHNAIFSNEGVGNAQTRSMHVLVLQDGRLEFDIRDGLNLVSTQTIPKNEWHHIAVTYDDNVNTNTRLYIDGTEVAAGRVTTPSAQATGWLIGRRATDLFFGGQIEEARMWNVARTATQIQQSRFMELAGNESGLVGYWTFNGLQNHNVGGDSTTDDLTDGTSNTNHGDLVGATALANSTAPVGNRDIQVTLTANATQPANNASVTYTATITNPSSAPATGLSVNIAATTGLTFVSATPASGSFNNSTWTVPSIAGNSNATLQLVYTFTGATAHSTVTADLATLDQPDTDSTPGSGSYGEDDQAFWTVFKPSSHAGHAFSLDGSNDYISIADADELDLTNAFTLETWMNISSSGHSALFSRDEVGASPGGSIAFQVLSDRRLTISVRGQDGVTTPASVINRDQWQHVAAAYDNTASPKLRLFVDGVEVAQTNTWSPPPALTTPWLLGRLGTSQFFGGQMDEVRMWNVARSQAQLQASMTQGLEGDESGLVAYYRADAGSGTTAFSGTGNHNGILNSGATYASSGAATQGQPDLELTMASNNPQPTNGQNVTFTLTLKNTSPAATGVQVTTNQTANAFTFVSSNPSQGTYNNGTGIWDVGTIAGGATKTLEVVQTFTGTAAIGILEGRVTQAHQGDSDATPNNDVLTEDDQSAVVTARAAVTAGQALSLNGTDQYVHIPDADALDLTTPFTLEAWVNISKTNGHSTVFSSAGVGTVPNRALDLLVLQDGRLEFEVRNNGSNLVSTQTIPKNEWHHIAVTYDDNVNTNTRLYIDGTEVASGRVTTPSAQSTGWLIGRRATDLFFGGHIDEARMWNVARTAQQIQTDRFNILPGNTTGLVASYRFDTSDGANVFDFAGANHGVLSGGASKVASTATIGNADVSLRATTSKTRPNDNENVTVTYTLSNSGPAVASNVQIGITPSAGLTFVSSNPSAGTFSNGTWTAGSVASGANATLQLVYTFTGTEKLATVRGAVTQAAPSDPDSTPGNNASAEDDDVSVSMLKTPAAKGRVLTLDGAGDYLEIPDSDALDLTTTYTLEAWVNVTKSGHATLFSKVGTQGASGGFSLLLRSDNKVEVEVRHTNFYQSPPVIQRNQWQHVAVTFDDNATPKLRVFVDGVEVGNTSAISAPRVLTTPLFIGVFDTRHHFGGHIDEARVWNVARTPEQIQEAMFSSLSGFETGLVANYRADVARNLKVNKDGTDDLFDHSPKRNHGDLVNGAVVSEQVSPIITNVSATDDLFEDKVIVSWQRNAAKGSLVQITRNNQLITSASSRDSTFTDTSGKPNVVYQYCAILASNGTVLGCDGGRRQHKAATNVTATDKAFTDKVTVSWSDNSSQNTHYRIFRDNTQIAEVAGSSTSYDDTSTLTLGQTYTYCVVPYENGNEGGNRVCDQGEIGSVLPPTDVAAADGTRPGYVTVTWKNQGTGATGFVIKRDGTTLTTAAANATSYDDLTAVAGQQYTYCVARQQTGNAISKDVCDTGSIGTLKAPINVAGSDGSFDDKIEVSWGSEGNDQSGFNVYRQGGYALTFDGANDYVSIPDANALDLTTRFTLEAWVNVSKTDHVTVFSKEGPSSAAGAFSLHILAGGRLEFEVEGSGAYQTSVSPVKRNQWHHVAATFDVNASPKLHLYVDGVEAGASSNIVTPSALATPMYLGRKGNGFYFGGQMDEVRIWNVARTESQLRATLFGAPTNEEHGLVSRLSLDDRTGTKARDVYGVHSGTLTNFALDTNTPGWALSTAPVDLYGSGLALHLDGSGDYMTANGVSASITTRATTIEGWIYPQQASNGVIWAFSEPTGVFQQRLLMYRGSTNQIVYDDNAINEVVSKAKLSLNQWHHVAVSIDANGNGTMYINGGADRTFITTTQTTNNARFSLGQAWNNTDPGNFFTGRMDNVRLWNTARTVTEIANNRFGTVAATSTGLVADWRFDKVESLGASANVQSGKVAQTTSFEISGTFNDIRNFKGTAHGNVVAGRLVQGRPQHMSATIGAAFTDFTATPGAGYEYCVAAYTVHGVETSLVCDAGARGTILAVTNVEATDGATEDKVDITWQNPGNRASAFIVYRNDVALETVPATTLTFTDKAIASVTKYNYCVSAVSQEGIESAKVCDQGYREIKQPSQFEATVNSEEHRVALRWQDESSIERGFKIYRRAYTNHAIGALAADSALVADLAVADQTQTYDLQGVPGTWYRYSIVAYDALGQSKSALDDGLRTLSSPSLVAAADGESETQVFITWEDRSNAETGYRIFRGTTALGTVAANARQFTDTNPPLGVTSTYGVEAYDALGTSARETDTGATTILAPGTVQASEVYTDKVVLTWADQSKVESGYRIFRGGTQVGNVGANVIDYADNTAAVGTAYQYCVAAISPAGGTSAQVCDSGTRAGTVAASDLTPMQVRLFPDDGVAGDAFGISVATAGDQIMIGAPDDANKRGSVYVFDRTETGWQQSAKLVPSRGADGDQFGIEVDMTETHAVVGAFRSVNATDNERSGVVYFYERREGGWVETQRLDDVGPGVDANYGFAVAIEGNWAIIGADLDDSGVHGADVGSITILENVNGTWTRRFAVPSPFGEGGERFGYSVAIYDQWAAVGAIFGGTGNDGRVALYRRNGSQWVLFQTMRENQISGAQFGRTLDIWNDYLIVGAIRAEVSGGPAEEGAAYIFKFDENAPTCTDKNQAAGAGCWKGQKQLTSDSPVFKGGFGQFVSISGELAVVGEVNEGAGASSNRVTHVYKRTNETWNRTAKLVASNRAGSVEFAKRVKISDAGTIISGDPLETGTGGTAYVTELAPKAPSNVAATNGQFENRIAVSWTDVSSNETGYHLYRDGSLIATLAADETSYEDYDALPGEVHKYCATSFLTTGFGTNTVDVDSPQICDLGWRFPDGTIAGQVLDNFGIGSDSTDVCLSPSPNGALMLDGVGGYAEMTDLTGDWPAAFTIEQWVFASDINATQAFSFKGDTNSGWGGLLVGGEVEFYFDGINSIKSGTGHVQSNTWHHVALTYDGTTARIFIDGTARGSVNMSMPPHSTKPYTVGRRLRSGGHGADLYFKGQIDDIRVWNHARTATQIKADKDAALTSEEVGLFAYWSADERVSAFMANSATGSRGKYYGTFNGGAYASRPGAPLRACLMTDDNGNYAFSAIRYGESTEFTLTPTSATNSLHTYAPVRKKVKLSRELPVQNEIKFNDLTKYNITGTIQYNNTQCFATDINLLVNGTFTESSDVNGQFVLSQDPGSVVLQPRASSGDHTFAPTSRSFLLDNHKLAQNFTDLTTRKLVIKAAGGSEACRKPIGQVKVKVRALNGCFEQEYTTDANGDLKIDLPPLEYAVQVQDLTNPVDAAQEVTIEKFFDELGGLRADLSTESDTLNFIYRAPVQVAIQGLAASACTTGDIADKLPLLTKNEDIKLTFSVFEDYGGGNTCPVDEANVVLFNEIGDTANAPDTLRITKEMNGKVDTTFTIGNPNILAGRIVDNIDRSYQKFVTAVAEVESRKGTATEWAVVTGAKPRLGAQFVTEAKTDVPLWVLRDPPGDQSYAYIEKGSETCNTFGTSASLSTATGLSLQVNFGGVVDLGVAFGGEASAVLQQKNFIKVAFKAGQSLAGGGGAQLCVATDQRISTFNDEDYFGDQADLFIGAGLNLIFAKADQLTVKQTGSTCNVSLTQATVLGPELETAFYYTRDEIKNRVIPRLKELRDNPTDGTPKNVDYTNAIKNWENMLKNADATADKTDLDSFGEDQNISFSAGAEYEYAKSNSKTSFGFIEREAFVQFEFEVGTSLDVAGSGFELEAGTEAEARLNFRWDREDAESTTYGYVFFDDDVGDSYTVDVYEDPTYGTAIYDVRAGFSSCPFEPWYDTPEVVAGGASSSTPQPRTASRDKPKLSINPPSLSDVDPSKPAVFTLTIGNESGTSEERNIRLGQLLTSNPGGAIVRASGLPLNTGESGSQHFIVPPGQSQEVTLEVMRGPNKYKYDRLGLVAYPPCEEGNLVRGRPWIADTLYFDVTFKAPCSDISIFRPKDRWALNRTTKASPLSVTLNDFTLSGTDNSEGLTEVGLEYRKAGDQDWTPAFAVPKATITGQGGASATSYTKNDWTFPGVDGAYEFRSYAKCANGTTYSDVITGSVDTKRPEVLGTPEPADQVLSLGDDIKVQFAEPIACTSVVTSGQNLNTTLRFPGGANIATKATCDGSMLTLEPTDPAFFNGQEGKIIEASVSGVTDAAGNPMLNPNIPGNPTEGAATWQFTVAQSSVAWSPVNHHVTVPFGQSQTVTVNLVNGTAQDASYTLEHATNSTLAAHMDLALLDNQGNATATVTDLTPSTTQGSVVARGSQPVTFTLPNTLALGSYRGQILARAVQNNQALGKVPFTLNVDVVCQAPTYTITPTDFEHNMTAMLRLFVNQQESQDVNDVVVAYVGNEVRGIAKVQQIATGTFRVPLVIYSNMAAGERVTLQVYDASTCKLYTETSRTFTFQADLSRGTPNKPVALDAPPRPSTDVALSAGWTWVSVNKTPTGNDMGLNNVLRDLGQVESGAGDIIKSQTQFSLFDQGTGDWLGSLTQLQPGRAYQMKMGQSTTLKMTGTAVDLNNHTVTLSQGWTWLGYSAQEALFINDALGFNTTTNQNIANVGVPNPDETDIIKSQFGFAQYVNGIGWVGSLDRLEPGRGYLIRTKNGGSLKYPDPGSFTNKPGAVTRVVEGEQETAALHQQADVGTVSERISSDSAAGIDKERLDETSNEMVQGKQVPEEEVAAHLSETTVLAGPGWSVDPVHYSHSMGLVATLEVDAFTLESEGAAIAATINDEVRGVGQLQYIEALDAYRAFVLIYGDVEEVRKVSFLLYDDETERVTAAQNTVTFEANAIVGSVTEPVVLSDATRAVDESAGLPTTFALDMNYPNPFNPETVIRYAVPEAIQVEVVVYDVLGREVMTLVNEELQAGRYELRFDGSGLSSGVYVYRMKAGSFVRSHRMILLK